MRRILVTDTCFNQILTHSGGTLSSGFTRVSGGWELQVTQDTLDRLLLHAARGESISETVERVVALSRRL